MLWRMRVMDTEIDIRVLGCEQKQRRETHMNEKNKNK